MSSSFHPQLSHCGVYARDVSKMVDFYTNVVGLVVSDRGISSRGGELAFMTAAPQHHHQFVIVSGRAPEGVSTVNQLSFKVPDLDALKTVYGRAREAGIETIRQTSHGNAMSRQYPAGTRQPQRRAERQGGPRPRAAAGDARSRRRGARS
jgi:catechol 2,3-dioxygenase